MSIVAIIGAGNLGSSITHRIALGDRVREIRLIDDTEHIAAGKALDIQQAGAIEPFNTRVIAERDLDAVIGADVIVIAERAEKGDTEWTGNAGIELIRQLGALNARAVTICAASNHGELVEAGVSQAGISRQRLVGSAPFALQLALRAVTALEFRCSPSNVTLTVIGMPPDNIIVPWNEVTVQGVNIRDRLNPTQLATLEKKVSRVWPPGPYTLAAATASLCESIVQETSEFGFPCFVVLDGELGVRNKVTAITAIVRKSGVTQIVEPSLTPQERVHFETALQSS